MAKNQKAAEGVKLKLNVDLILLESIEEAKPKVRGAAHGALFALEMAVIDLKNRAKSAKASLGEDCSHILDQIEAL